jgi:hypothetical protein
MNQEELSPVAEVFCYGNEAGRMHIGSLGFYTNLPFATHNVI